MDSLVAFVGGNRMVDGIEDARRLVVRSVKSIERDRGMNK